MRILAVGGGSGGHVTPVAAVLSELAHEKEQLDVLFVCDKGFRTQSEGIMGELPFPVQIKTIPSGKLRRYAHFSWWHYIRHFSIILRNIADTVKTVGGFFSSLWLIARFKPDVVFAKGGFVCLPVGYAARFLRVPLVIHDSDVRPGLTNKLLARFAQAIGTGMPLENYTYDARRTSYVGVPINPAITPVTESVRALYRKELALPLNQKLVVAVGGGLGSATINQAIIETAKNHEVSGSTTTLFYNVTGVKNIHVAEEQAAGVGCYTAVPFVYKDMYKLLGAADVVVTRASATTLQELAGLKQAVVAVPAKQLGDQQKNAALFAQYNAVVALKDDELSERLDGVLRELLQDERQRHELAENLHSFARPHAARDMARIIRKAAR